MSTVKDKSITLSEDEIKSVGSHVEKIVDHTKFKLNFLEEHLKAVIENPSKFPEGEYELTTKDIENCRNELARFKSLNENQLGPQVYQGRLTQIPVYYHDYLCLDDILGSQRLQSAKYGKPEHHEHLFIVIHQAYELWFKQILHEIGAVIRKMSQDNVPEKEMAVVLHHLERVIEIQKLMVKQFDVLETLSPLDFMDFRDYLFPASGFQSWQFRLLENTLGLQSDRRVQYERKAYHTRLSDVHSNIVTSSENGETLFSVTQKWLERTPFLKGESFDFMEHYKAAASNMYEEDKKVAELIHSNPGAKEELQKELNKIEENKKNFLSLFDETTHNEQIAGGSRRLSYQATQAALLISIFQDEPLLHLPFKFLQALTLIDELFTQWRSKHVMMVHRMIGSKVGTGGSSGYWYLRATVEKGRVFSDIGNMSTYLIPRGKVPDLPEEIKKKVAYAFTS